MDISNNECKHYPIAHASWFIRFIKLFTLSHKEVTCFRCSFCGAYLRLPDMYTNVLLKIGYLIFPTLITIGLFQIQTAYGIQSRLSKLLLLCAIYFFMYIIQALTSSAILAFSNWREAENEMDARNHVGMMKKQDTGFRSLWLLGVSLAIGYIVELPWWSLSIVLVLAICSILITRAKFMS